MTVVETTVWVDLLRDRHTPQTEWLKRNRDDPKVGLSDLILCEVLQGLRRGENYEQVRRGLMGFDIVSMSGVELAEAAASNYRFLRGRGVTIRSTIDCLVATYCIREGHSLVHNDRDYDPFERYLELKVIHP